MMYMSNKKKRKCYNVFVCDMPFFSTFVGK